MRQPKVAQRYAKALFDLAVERNELEKIKADLEGIKELDNHQELKAVWNSPVIQGEKKQKIFAAILDGKVSPTTTAFFDLLFKKGREIAVGEITNAFNTMYRRHHNIQLVEITTAAPVSQEVNDFIVSKLKNRARFASSTLEVTNKVDAAIVGGFVLHVDDVLYDASIRHDLQVIRKQFIENMYIQKLR
jgi:F-type H+-transporting ATPase subunit delta